MGSYELNKKLTIARANGFEFNQINKLTITIYSYLSHINICYYFKQPIPMCHRQFFRKLFKKIVNIYKLIVLIEEIVFNLHVVNGIHIIIHNVDKI